MMNRSREGWWAVTKSVLPMLTSPECLVCSGSLLTTTVLLAVTELAELALAGNASSQSG